MMTKFTIFSAARNTGDWARKNVESVAAQSYKDYEHIYVDDASTDDTFAIAVEGAKASSQCRIVRNTERIGFLANLFANLEAMQGEIIIQLDGDDWFASPRALETIAAAYDDPEVDVSFGSYLFRRLGAEDHELIESTELQFADPVDRPRTAWYGCHHPPRTFRKSLIARILNDHPGAYVRKDPETGKEGYTTIAGDLYMIYPAIYYARKIAIIRKRIYVVNQHMAREAFSVPSQVAKELHIARMRWDRIESEQMDPYALTGSSATR
jgi:glycosyltransferase involved in cell wall biosynthesis